VKSEQAHSEEEIPVDLKNPALAAFLAWLVPGLGHFYQRRTAKAILFFVCIVSTFVYGLYLGSGEGLGVGRVVYASWRDTDRRLPYLCQIGVGLPALPAVVQAMRVRNGQEPLFGQFMAPPRLGTDGRDPPTINRLHRELHRYFDIGTAYTMIAGLLNILAIYDAWGGPVFTEYGKQDDEEEEDQGQPESEKSSSDDA
jgi:hypothetical protein